MNKSWWEKESAFETAFSRGTIAKTLWPYIPQHLNEAVTDCTVTSDGYWIYLEPGWRAYDLGADCGIIHEYTIRELQAAIKTIQKY